MSAYPVTSHLLGSTQELESSYQDDIDQSGGLHSRAFFSKQYYRFKLLHSRTLAQFNTLLADYAANPKTVRTLTYHDVSPQVTYSVFYLAPPAIVDNLGGDRFIVEVNLRGFQD